MIINSKKLLQIQTILECANIARERQRFHDERCNPTCKCSDGYHVAMALEQLAKKIGESK